MVPSFSSSAAAILLLFLILASSASATNFTCTGPATCQSAIVYTPPAATTYIELLSSFETTTLRDLFDANGLPPSTPSHTAIPANATVIVPFRCSCVAGANRPESQPFHIIQPNDNMSYIAAQFDDFVTYQEIAAASNISNPDFLEVGQELWIPLPCSCDQVEGNNVTHFAYKVRAADNVSKIAARFGVKESTLLKINGITDPKNLTQGQILDVPVPDRDKSKELGWEKRFKIIIEIARGLEYLHEESRLKIIHRDLKANNILLDSDLTPKISDFGLAKLFGEDQSHVVTNRVAGTYGYMAPEYAMFGQYSVKSDVFSFGVLILEIITGRRSMGSFNDHEQSFSLLDLIWQHWNSGTILNLVDPSLSRDAGGQLIQRDQLLGCIHVALLCVQENPADRPKLSAVTMMIGGGSNSTASLNPPSRPAFCMHPADATRTAAGGEPAAASANRVSLTELQPR
ncbi:hypothetical protein OsI_36433 [Oryza sativa Indica Group]|uniref:Protein kinase domain-containing protein n=1 Tax=Oryza sativa subsp. indica TaxID=39946 RepID=B8BKZ5_ORYSI|nr:hypothetical protein OsI_36433 [Oryza sativa Indica Group]